MGAGWGALRLFRGFVSALKRSAAHDIVVVLHDLPLGGTERIAVRLSNRWAAAGRRVTLFCGALQGPLTALVGEGVELVECAPAIPRGAGSRARLGEALARFVATRRPDLLFAPGNFHWPALPALARLDRGAKPAIVAQVSTPLHRPGRGPLQQLGYDVGARARLGIVDGAVSLSAPMTRDVDRLLGRRITRCIPLPALEDEAPPLAPAQGRLIVAAGRLVREKGFDVALRAFARLRDPQARLAILGEGPRRAELERLAVRLGVADRVEMPGYVPDIRPWLDRARCFLLSSWYEGYAAVVVEALAAGRPVVATDCTPAANDLLRRDPARGAVAPIGDARRLAQALHSVLDAPPPDPRALAAAVAGYRIQPIAEAYLELFDEIVDRRAAERPSSLPASRPASSDRLLQVITRRLASMRVTGPAADKV
jgi:glycosyltransferase involved in cell wall biosynthesis